jgi:hypothetical protein
MIALAGQHLFENLHHSAWLIFPCNTEYTIEVSPLYFLGPSELIRKLKP